MSENASRFDVFRAALEQPRQLALVTDHQSLSYEALAFLAGRALAWLRQRGIASGTAPVAVLARPASAQIAMCQALWALRVPLLPVHPSLTREERDELLERAGARVLVDESWGSDAPDAPRTPAPPGGADDESCMALLETSGSSGRSHLCRLSRRAFAASARASAERLAWQSGDRWLLCLPFAHVGGLSILTRCLDRRATVVASMLPRGANSGDALAGAIMKHAPTLVSVVPTQLVRLLDHTDFELPSAVRVMLVGGAELPVQSFELARRRGWPVAPTYGLTEACSQVATALPGEAMAGCGRPLAGLEVRVTKGQIEIRGDSLFSGYLGETTRSPGDWFPTGDLGTLDAAGRLHVLGRASDRIVTGGENVDPIEVENALAGVSRRRVCVAGRAHPEWGEQVVVFIEGPDDASVVAAIVERAQSRLAPFKRPRLYAFVDAFPLGPSGKVHRRELAARQLRLAALSYVSDNA